MAREKFSSIDAYISAASKETQPILEAIRAEIKARVPTAVEVISYNMPAFKDGKNFVYFAAFKRHIGIYPPLKDTNLKNQLKAYMNEKGNLAFQFAQGIPIELIGDIALALWKQHQS